MVTSPYQWKNLEWDEKTQNKQKQNIVNWNVEYSCLEGMIMAVNIFHILEIVSMYM